MEAAAKELEEQAEKERLEQEEEEARIKEEEERLLLLENTPDEELTHGSRKVQIHTKTCRRVKDIMES